MKIAMILALLIVSTVLVACTQTTEQFSKTSTKDVPAENSQAASQTSDVVENPETIAQELSIDPYEDIGTLDDIPVDDTIPE
jgi:archaellum component FlaG (FlaF/FlaG flagellin family)